MSDNGSTENESHYHKDLSFLGTVECSRFASGWGFTFNNVQFAIEINNSLFLHTNETLREELKQNGAQPFSYTSRGKQVIIERFYSVPNSIIENASIFESLVQRSYSAAEKGIPTPQASTTPVNLSDTVLLICTSHSSLGNTGNSTGVWFPELAVAYNYFLDEGFSPIIASVSGGLPPIDPGSNSAEFRHEDALRFESDETAMTRFRESLKLSEIEDCSSYEAALLIGGHGSMWDFPDNESLEWILSQLLLNNKPIAGVCHGVAGLLNINPNTEVTFATGKNITCFSNAEEELIGLSKIVPFLLESRLRENGAHYSEAEPLTAHTVTDGLVITGQNPFSSKDTTLAIIDTIRQKDVQVA